LTVFLTVHVHLSSGYTVMPISDIAVRNARPRERSFKLPDGEGIYLFVHSQGGKSFRLDYWHQSKPLTLGAYPETTLAEARNRRHEANKAVIRATITSPWSNVQTEGQTTKLKLVILTGPDPSCLIPDFDGCNLDAGIEGCTMGQVLHGSATTTEGDLSSNTA
jgi:Arm DNA-binding domain